VAVHLQNLYFNSFLFALANLPGNILSILYSDKWGRKSMLVGSLLGAASSLGGFAVLVYFGGNAEQEQDNAWLRTDAIVLFACAFQMFSIVSWNTIDIMR
jgi:MFS family permease